MPSPTSTTAPASNSRQAIPTTQAEPDATLPSGARCDACRAKAVTRAVLSHGPLDFCGHHTNRHLPALIAQGATVNDTRQH